MSIARCDDAAAPMHQICGSLDLQTAGCSTSGGRTGGSPCEGGGLRRRIAEQDRTEQNVGDGYAVRAGAGHISRRAATHLDALTSDAAPQITQIPADHSQTPQISQIPQIVVTRSRIEIRRRRRKKRHQIISTNLVENHQKIARKSRVFWPGSGPLSWASKQERARVRRWILASRSRSRARARSRAQCAVRTCGRTGTYVREAWLL